MNFWNSSQKNEWLFTPETLKEHRHKAYLDSARMFKLQMSEADHLRYVNYYCEKLLTSSKEKLNFNRYQRYTALALMQRIYIHRTIWEIPPPLALIACIFIISKFHAPESLDHLLSCLGFGTDFYDTFKPKEQMAQIEIQVLAAIDFKMKIHLPFHQVLAVCDHQPFAEKHEECQAQLYRMLMTDALLLYPPGQIAVAAVAKVIGIDDTMNAIPEEFSDRKEELREIVDQILSMDIPMMSEEEVRGYDDSLKTEFAVFHQIDHTKTLDDGTNPVSLLPPM